MIPCLSCGCHVRAGEGACPSCGSSLTASVVRTASAALLGLALAGCTGSSNNVDYGTPPTDLSETDTDTDTDTDADADADTDTDADTDETGGTGAR